MQEKTIQIPLSREKVLILQRLTGSSLSKQSTNLPGTAETRGITKNIQDTSCWPLHTCTMRAAMAGCVVDNLLSAEEPVEKGPKKTTTLWLQLLFVVTGGRPRGRDGGKASQLGERKRRQFHPEPRARPGPSEFGGPASEGVPLQEKGEQGRWTHLREWRRFSPMKTRVGLILRKLEGEGEGGPCRTSSEIARKTTTESKEKSQRTWKKREIRVKKGGGSMRKIIYMEEKAISE